MEKNRLKWLLSLAFVALALGAYGKPGAPTGLLVNGVTNPLAIDRDSARFTWMSAGRGRGESQSAFQILVASSRDQLNAGNADYWDSGKVFSGNSASVEYGGKVLPSAARLWWKVRIWDQEGKPGPYSAPARFDTGLNQDEWTASYIWDGTTNFNNFAYFRKTFLVTNQPSRAKVYVTAHNDYLLFLNGQLLGRGPARSDPYRYGQYNAYDVTKLLRRGTNAFAAIGHWQGTWRDSGYNAKPAFLLQARLDYPGGSSVTIGTDNSWKVLAHTAFIETNATYFIGSFSNRAAIQFDSRQEPAGWRRADFDDSTWAPATVVDCSDYHLFAQRAPLEREQAELKPVSITQTNGAWLVDFGRCIDGWPKITIRGNRPGDAVRIDYFELTGQRRPAGWDQYICHGGRETWDADFGRHTTFQVLKITGYAGKLKASDVRGMWAYCDADVAGRFRCSSQLLNDIYKMCERSARQNIQQGIISVDANREQSPWLADSWNIGNVLLYNHRDTAMIDKIVRDYAAEQMPDGSFQDCSPTPLHWVCAEWSMYWPMLLWQQYLFSGDGGLLREMAPRLAHSLQWLKTGQDPKTKLINPRSARISDYAGGNMPSGGYNAATACQYYENLMIASRVFSFLGKPGKSSEYLRQARELGEGINSNLFNGRFYLARTDREEMFPIASAWALRFNIEPAWAKRRILATIEAAGKPDIGGYGGDALYSGLWNAGAGDFVVKDMARYRPMLEENKANWESWSIRAEVNHAWSSYPGYLFQKYVLGIQPTGGGFATFDVRPETSGLSFAEGAVPTVKGTITTSWKNKDDHHFSLSIHVPANTRATVYIPKISSENVMLKESGKLLWPDSSGSPDAGVIAVSEEGDSIKCLVSAGDYHFVETCSNDP